MSAIDSNLERRYYTPRLAWLGFLLVFGGPLVYCWSRQDHVTAAVVLLLAVGSLSAYQAGLSKMASVFAAIGLAALIAPKLGPKLEFLVGVVARVGEGAAPLVSWGLAGFFVWIMTFLTLRLVAWSLLRDRPMLQCIDCWCGFAVGLAQGVVLILLTFGGIILLEPYAKNRLHSQYKTANLSTIVSHQVVAAAKQLRASSVGAQLIAANPFDRVPQLRRFKQQLERLANANAPDATSGNSDAAAALRDKPSVRRAIDELQGDAQLKELLTSGKSLGVSDAMSLMSNPTIRKMLDDPQLINDVHAAMQGGTPPSPHP